MRRLFLNNNNHTRFLVLNLVMMKFWSCPLDYASRLSILSCGGHPILVLTRSLCGESRHGGECCIYEEDQSATCIVRVNYGYHNVQYQSTTNVYKCTGNRFKFNSNSRGVLSQFHLLKSLANLIIYALLPVEI